MIIKMLLTLQKRDIELKIHYKLRAYKTQKDGKLNQYCKNDDHARIMRKI